MRMTTLCIKLLLTYHVRKIVLPSYLNVFLLSNIFISLILINLTLLKEVNIEVYFWYAIF